MAALIEQTIGAIYFIALFIYIGRKLYVSNSH